LEPRRKRMGEPCHFCNCRSGRRDYIIFFSLWLRIPEERHEGDNKNTVGKKKGGTEKRWGGISKPVASETHTQFRWNIRALFNLTGKKEKSNQSERTDV